MAQPTGSKPSSTPQAVVVLCEQCQKTEELCICDTIRELKTRLHVLILQHPQEPDKDLGSARIAHLALPNSTLKVGLSWPNIKKALGHETTPSRWAVLYLGSGLQKSPSGERQKAPKESALYFVDKKGQPLPEPPKARDLDGIIVLDGTWSQAKALWWRNAWLLKCRRVILQSSYVSQYRELRKEPRRECLSTIETIAETLQALGEPKVVSEELKATFGRLLERRREQIRAKREARKNCSL